MLPRVLSSVTVNFKEPQGSIPHLLWHPGLGSVLLCLYPSCPQLKPEPLFSDICRAGFILYCVSCLWKPFTHRDSRTWTCSQTCPLNVLSSHTVTASPTYLSDRSVQCNQLMARSYPPSPACFIRFRRPGSQASQQILHEDTVFSSPSDVTPALHHHHCPPLGSELLSPLPTTCHSPRADALAFMLVPGHSLHRAWRYFFSNGSWPPSDCCFCCWVLRFKKQQSGEGQCNHLGAYSLDSGASAFSSRLPCPHSLNMQSCNTAVLDLIKPSFPPQKAPSVTDFVHHLLQSEYMLLEGNGSSLLWSLLTSHPRPDSSLAYTGDILGSLAEWMGRKQTLCRKTITEF